MLAGGYFITGIIDRWWIVFAEKGFRRWTFVGMENGSGGDAFPTLARCRYRSVSGCFRRSCLFISITGIALGGLFKRNTQQTGGVSGALSAFLVFACFSYPLHMLPMAMLFVLLLAWSVNVGTKGVRVRRWAGQILWLPVMVLVLAAAWRLAERNLPIKHGKLQRLISVRGIIKRH